MNELNEKELNVVSGGIPYMNSTCTSAEAEKRKLYWEWVDQEKRKMEGLADIRMRASEDALKAAMRLNKQEADIKEAMKAQREALGLN